jgi:predicted HTH domain antitoxin
MSNSNSRYDDLPDVRDGLNKKERIILYCLREAQKEFNDRNVPTVTLYGRVVEHIDISVEEFQHILSRLTGLTRNTDM